MDFQYVLLIAFIALMLVFLWFERKNIQVQGLFPLFYFVMWRTKKGLGLMDRIAGFAPRFWSWFFGFGIIIGFIGMIIISYELVHNTVLLFTSPETAPGIQPVLPFEAKGVFFVPFVYWILSIFLIAVIHEFCHGIAARVHNTPVKSAGLAFLGIIAPIVPAAFVEPDEQYLQKQSRFRQLSVFSAGPFSNLVMAGIMILVVMFFANPLAESMLLPGGVKITGTEENSPAALAGLKAGYIITSVGGQKISLLEDLTTALKAYKPGDIIQLEANGTHSITLTENPKNTSLAYLGIFSRQHAEIQKDFVDKYGAWSVPVILWLFGLVYWLFLLSLGIGLFNLLPIGPIDGGRMLQLGMQKLFKQQRGQWLWKYLSIMFFGMVIVNVIAGFF
jgi:membrane-associated protease RseP (regulator of RpoE activity)